mgnify:FL=1
MRISELIEKLNDAFKTYGDIPVNISTFEEAYEDDIEDIQADGRGVTIFNY